MRHAWILALGWVLAGALAPRLAGQEVIDRVVARVENDIILMSDLRTLGRYQQLVDGKSDTEAQLLERMIDQWIVRSEADTARFPPPSDADLDRGIERVQKTFATPADYEEHRKQVGLTDAEIRSMVAAQLYLSNYLDSRFRPSVQVSPKDVEDFYQNAVIPRAQARGQAPPPLEEARDYIQEALVRRGIDEQTGRWLKETRGRVHVERLLDEGKP